jgi:HEAT repeat protein
VRESACFQPYATSLLRHRTFRFRKDTMKKNVLRRFIRRWAAISLVIAIHCSLPPALYCREYQVDELIPYLTDRSPAIRTQAVQALATTGDPRAVEPLIAALKDNDFMVRSEVATALGKMKEPRAVRPLIALLNDTRAGVWASVRGALTEIGAPAVESLIFALRDNERHIRDGAAVVLGRIKDPRAVEPLIWALKDKVSHVRATAAEALGKIGDPRAVKPLTALLRQVGPRTMAAKALVGIGQPAVQSLISVWATGDGGSKGCSIAALSVMKNEEALSFVNSISPESESKEITADHGAVIRKGKKGSEFPLIIALMRHGKAPMAVDFLNSGNEALAEGARLWIFIHNFSIIPGAGQGGVRWGR